MPISDRPGRRSTDVPVDPGIRTLDEDALAHWLQAELPDFHGPVATRKFPGGQSNPTYLIQAGDARYVLRRKPPGKLLKSAHAVDREYRVLQALHGSQVPVARPLALCRDDAVIGSMFYVMEYVPGRIFWDPALPELAAAGRRAVFDEMVRVLAAVHDVDLEQTGLQDYGRPGNYFERQTARWTRQYRASETQSVDAMEFLIGWLPDRLPADDGCVSLIHGDYRLDNLIFDTGQARIRAVLDWELSTLGHPLADLAYLCVCLRLPRSGRLRGLAGLPLAELGIPDERGLVGLYRDLRGIPPIDEWNFYLAFSLFRLAAICQGITKRALDGNAASDQARETGRLARPLAELGAAIAREPARA